MSKKHGPRVKPQYALVPLPDFEMMYRSLVNSLSLESEPKKVIKRAYDHVQKNGQFTTSKEDQKIAEEAGMALGFDNDHVFVKAVPTQYITLAIQIRRQLIKDFSCTTYADKCLVDTIVNGYIQNLNCMHVFNVHLMNITYVAHKQTNELLAILSKEMDRANRHMMAAFHTLMSMKQPIPTVQIKAQNAYFAKNQVNVREP